MCNAPVKIAPAVVVVGTQPLVSASPNRCCSSASNHNASAGKRKSTVQYGHYQENEAGGGARAGGAPQGLHHAVADAVHDEGSGGASDEV